MKKENDLMDSLLKEHAMMKKNGEVDEQFLQDLEERLDAEEASAIVDNKVVSLNIDEREASTSQTSVRSWALGLGLAACATFGFVAYQKLDLKPQSADNIVLNSGVVAEQLESADIEHSSVSEKRYTK